MGKKIYNKKATPKITPQNKQAINTQSAITFTVNFYSGAGGIYFHGENIPDNKYISSAMADKTFSIQQTAGHQVVTVAGSAPSEGKLTVEVSQGIKVLSPAGDNAFDKMTFSGFIVYTI
jgi:hypothetical protein